MVITTTTPEQTRRAGRLLGQACRGGEVILLEGELGAGKTTLAQGLGAGLGIASPIISPTFVLLRVYEGRLPLYHFDFYRLAGTGRAVDLEFDDYFNAGGVCIVEWPSNGPDLDPAGYLRLTFHIRDGTNRDIVLEPSDARHADLAAALEGGAVGLTGDL